MKRALIVDDTKNIRLLLKICLENEGYQVTAVEDGKAALLVLHDEHFDLIFLDIKMPEISGTDVLKRIRALGLDIPVIIITAFATVKNAVECTKLGATAYLQKPFTPDKIRNVLDEVVGCKSLNESYYEIWMRKGYMQMETEQYQEALDTFKKCLSIKPENYELYNLLGNIYEKLGKFTESNRFYAIAGLFK